MFGMFGDNIDLGFLVLCNLDSSFFIGDFGLYNG